MDREILDLVPYWAGMVFFLALACVVGVSYLLLRLWFRSDQDKRDQARSDWINGISHDIRTPLSVVMGYASQMESDGSLGERPAGAGGHHPPPERDYPLAGGGLKPHHAAGL